MLILISKIIKSIYVFECDILLKSVFSRHLYMSVWWFARENMKFLIVASHLEKGT